MSLKNCGKHLDFSPYHAIIKTPNASMYTITKGGTMAGRYPKRFNDDSILARYFGRSANYTNIPNYLFNEYNVKKGLRNDDGTGVRIGLTSISPSRG